MKDVNSHACVTLEKGHVLDPEVLCVIHTLDFSNICIEFVVVSSKHRGNGLGRVLVEHMINEAKRINVHSIHLSSDSKRCSQ